MVMGTEIQKEIKARGMQNHMPCKKQEQRDCFRESEQAFTLATLVLESRSHLNSGQKVEQVECLQVNYVTKARHSQLEMAKQT